MQILLFTLFCLSYLLPKSLALFQGDSVRRITTLDVANRETQLSNYLSALLFCSSKNPVCKEVDHEYNKFGEKAKGWVNAYGLDCEALDPIEKSGLPVCSDDKIKDHPILIFLQPGNNEEGERTMTETIYEGYFDVESLEMFALNLVPSFSTPIKSKNQLEKLIKDRPQLKIVLLFTEDDDLPLSYKILTSEYKDRIKFGTILDQPSKFLKEFKVPKFPTLVIYQKTEEGTPEIEVYKGEFKADQLKDFVRPFASETKVPVEPKNKSPPGTIFPLSVQNFTEEVQKVEQLVMVHLYENDEFPILKDTIGYFQSLFTYFSLNCTSQKAKSFAKEKFGVDMFPVLIVLPIGNKEKLKPSVRFEKFNNLVEIKKEVSESIADKTINMRSDHVQTELTDALTKGKIVFILFYDAPDISMSYRALSQLSAYQDKIVFANVRRPPPDITEAFALDKLPTLISLFIQGEETDPNKVDPDSVSLARFKEKYVYHELKKFVDQVVLMKQNSQKRTPQNDQSIEEKAYQKDPKNIPFGGDL